MLLAVATLLLQIGPALHPLPDATLVIVADTETASANSVQPDSSASGAKQDASGAGAAATLTAASLKSSDASARSLASVRLPDPPTPKPVEVISVQNSPSRRNWLILTVAQHSAAAFDAYSTRQAVTNGAVERDPFMHPFAGSPAMYITIQLVPVGLDFAARHMQRSEHPTLRRTWWIPQTAATGLFLFSGVHNLHVANSHPQLD